MNTKLAAGGIAFCAAVWTRLVATMVSYSSRAAFNIANHSSLSAEFLPCPGSYGMVSRTRREETRPCRPAVSFISFTVSASLRSWLFDGCVSESLLKDLLMTEWYVSPDPKELCKSFTV
jgi:hypothetical protein